MTSRSESAIEFVTSAEIVSYSSRHVVGAESTDETTPDFAAPDLAVSIGSQLASFGSEMPSDLKKSISHGFLFAQQVADKQAQMSPGAGSTAWYESYIDVLSRIGWRRTDQGATLQEVSGLSGDLHKEIIPIISTALGPLASAAAVVTVLEGLQRINESSPWIALFNRTAQRTSATQFQVSHAEVVHGTPQISLVAFDLSAEQAVTQVLFFKFTSNNASLRKLETVMAVDEAIFTDVAPILEQRLKERTKDFIQSIPLL